MFLSNVYRYFLPVLFIFAIFQACSGPTANKISNANVGEVKTEFPFNTKEPEVYQGDFVVILGTSEEHFRKARKGSLSRIDFFRGGEILTTQLVTDKSYTIDHSRKVYFEEPIAADSLSAIPVFDSTNGFFAGKEYTTFVETGREGKITKYRVKAADPAKGEVIVSVDTSSGMMIRQEFLSAREEAGGSGLNVIFEIRDLRLEVDETVFELPAGYRKVSKDEYRISNLKTGK